MNGVVRSDEQAELLADFIAESLELLVSCEERLVALEEQPHRVDLIRDLMRSFHTIKGNSAYFALKEISDLAHRLEALLLSVEQQGGVVGADVFAQLLAGVDRLRALVQGAATGAARGRETDVADYGDGVVGRFLVFQVEGVDAALPLAQVDEVTRPAPVTRLPYVPPHVIGVMNLRGTVVPVVDLERRLLGTEGRSRIRHLVVVPWGSGRVALGVRQVIGVVNLEGAEAEAFAPAESFAAHTVLHNGRAVVVLDLHRVLEREVVAGG